VNFSVPDSLKMMKHLSIPAKLEMEFATVGACWNSQGTTRRVDSLVLSWIKYEKQLRRLFCFLIFQHPKIDKKQIDKVISILAENRRLYPETFVKGIAALKVRPVPDLLGQNYKNQWKERISACTETVFSRKAQLSPDI